MSQQHDLAVLGRALDQLAEILSAIPPEARADATPCADWNVKALVDHVVAAPEKFARMVRDESIDRAAPAPSAGNGPAAERGLSFMKANLTPDNRAPVFGPEQPAPESADAYQHIAAFAGRVV